MKGTSGLEILTLVYGSVRRTPHRCPAETMMLAGTAYCSRRSSQDRVLQLDTESCVPRYRARQVRAQPLAFSPYLEEDEVMASLRRESRSRRESGRARQARKRSRSQMPLASSTSRLRHPVEVVCDALRRQL